MPIIDVVRLAIAIGLTGALIWAAISDVRVRLIPNLSVLIVLGLSVLWIVVNRGTGLASALEAAVIAFVVTVALYAFKIMGAGDAKLFSAIALFAGLEQLPILAAATALTGGAIGAVSLASRPKRTLAMLTLRGRGDFGRGIPYGVAIAVGGALTIWIAISTLIPLPWSQAIRHGLAEVSL